MNRLDYFAVMVVWWFSAALSSVITVQFKLYLFLQIFKEVMDKSA